MKQAKLTAIAKKIKLLILDNDGVLTDGKIYFNDAGEQMLSFHIHDGLGIKRAQNAGILVAIISGRDSKALRCRIHELGIDYAFLGQHEKNEAFDTLTKQLNLPMENIAYAGDDLLDIPVMQKVALPITVANAVDAVKDVALYCTLKKGGEGAVREICEFLLDAM